MKMKIIAFALGLLLLSVVLCGCGKNREITRMAANDNLPSFQKLEPTDESTSPVDSSVRDDSTNTELVALADTLEEAEEIAKLYGIELSTYSYGVATYTTDKNYQELIDLGAENNYPTLSPNYDFELHDEIELHTEQ